LLLFQGGLEQGTVLVKRPGAEIEMLERIGTSERDAGRLAVIISAMANTTGGTIFIGRNQTRGSHKLIFYQNVLVEN